MNNVVFKNTVFLPWQKADSYIQLVEKVCFFKKVLVLNPYPL